MLLEQSLQRGLPQGASWRTLHRVGPLNVEALLHRSLKQSFLFGEFRRAALWRVLSDQEITPEHMVLFRQSLFRFLLVKQLASAAELARCNSAADLEEL